MRLKHLFPVLLLLIASGATRAQFDDEAAFDEFLNDQPIEGSGNGVFEEPVESRSDITTVSILEDMDPTTQAPAENESVVCPEACTCSTEGDGDSVSFIVDCSDKDLQEFPLNLDTRTTELNLKNNRITEIPKLISELQSLRVLNAKNNSIKDIAAGSISELPELRTLNLANNRLLEYPQDLKNGFSLVNLQEIDLGGNDIRSTLSVDDFSNFKSLHKLTLPTSEPDFVEVLCNTYKETLNTVCVGSCEGWANECPDAPEHIEGDFFDAKIPGSISLSSALDDLAPIGAVEEQIATNTLEGVLQDEFPHAEAAATEAPSTIESETTEAPSIIESETPESSSANGTPSPDFSLRSAVIKESAAGADNVPMTNAAIEIPTELSNITEGDVKTGATTSSTNTGAVDKSVIGLIVAGMIVIVAGITIKKNWSSIRKKFSSDPRTTSERNGTNGVTPEEVPLKEKEKSPV